MAVRTCQAQSLADQGLWAQAVGLGESVVSYIQCRYVVLYCIYPGIHDPVVVKPTTALNAKQHVVLQAYFLISHGTSRKLFSYLDLQRCMRVEGLHHMSPANH